MRLPDSYDNLHTDNLHTTIYMPLLDFIRIIILLGRVNIV